MFFLWESCTMLFITVGKSTTSHCVGYYMTTADAPFRLSNSVSKLTSFSCRDSASSPKVSKTRFICAIWFERRWDDYESCNSSSTTCDATHLSHQTCFRAHSCWTIQTSEGLCLKWNEDIRSKYSSSWKKIFQATLQQKLLFRNNS